MMVIYGLILCVLQITYFTVPAAQVQYCHLLRYTIMLYTSFTHCFCPRQRPQSSYEISSQHKQRQPITCKIGVQPTVALLTRFSTQISTDLPACMNPMLLQHYHCKSCMLQDEHALKSLFTIPCAPNTQKNMHMHGYLEGGCDLLVENHCARCLLGSWVLPGIDFYGTPMQMCGVDMLAIVAQGTKLKCTTTFIKCLQMVLKEVKKKRGAMPKKGVRKTIKQRE